MGGLCGLAALGVTWPLWRAPTRWGAHDWPQFYAWYEIPRRTLVEFGQVPLWDPFLMGGRMAIGHPHAGFLSPWFLPVLAWGPVVGLKLAAASFVGLGLWGMTRLARSLQCRPAAGLLMAVVWGLNGWFALSLAVGHVDHLPLLLLPWVVDAVLRRRAVEAGAVWALIYLAGGPYPCLLTGVFLGLFAGFRGWSERSLAPLTSTGAVALWALGFSAVKLLPTVDFMTQWVPIPADSPSATVPLVARGLLDRALPLVAGYHGPLGSWEYGAYVGIIPALLAVWSLRERSPLASSLVGTGAVCLALAWGCPNPLWPFPVFFKHLPLLRSFHVPFRFIVLTILAGSLLMGIALTRWAGAVPWRRRMLWALALGVGLDLGLVNSRFARQAAILAPPAVVVEQTTFHQRRIGFSTEPGSLQDQWREPYAAAMYENVLRGEGTVDAYDTVHLPLRARAVGDAGYRGEAFLAQGSGPAVVRRFTPNVLTIETNAAQRDWLVLNQNTQRGWWVRSRGRVAPARAWEGLIAAPVPAGRQTVTFTYLPLSALLGAAVTLVTLGLALGRAARACRAPPRRPRGG